jgi:hypothetical protein
LRHYERYRTVSINQRTYGCWIARRATPDAAVTAARPAWAYLAKHCQRVHTDASVRRGQWVARRHLADLAQGAGASEQAVLLVAG